MYTHSLIHLPLCLLSIYLWVNIQRDESRFFSQASISQAIAIASSTYSLSTPIFPLPPSVPSFLLSFPPSFLPSLPPSLPLSLFSLLISVSFVFVSVSDPGSITLENVGRYVARYPPEGKIFQGGSCTTCKTRKPARSKHCPACHRCVPRFDHHCGE